jgi:hypothetical protein
LGGDFGRPFFLGSISVSTITCAVNGTLTQGLVRHVVPEIKTVAGHNAIYLFGLLGK